MLSLKHLEDICNDILVELVNADPDEFEYRMGTYEINFEDARIDSILQKHYVSWEQLNEEEACLVYKPVKMFAELNKHFGLITTQQMLAGKKFDLPMYYS